jgi:hypothetical protein
LPAHIPIGDKEYDKMEVETRNDFTIDFEAVEDKQQPISNLLHFHFAKKMYISRWRWHFGFLIRVPIVYNPILLEVYHSCIVDIDQL